MERSRSDGPGHRRRRRGRPLRGTTCKMGRRAGARDGQFIGEGRAGAPRRRRPCHRLQGRGRHARAMAFTGQRGVDRVIDVDFGGNIARTLKLMALNSTIAVYATNGNRNPVIPMRELMEKCIALRSLVLFALPPPLLAAAQVDISKWLAEGERIHNIAAQFALSETALAHLAVEKGDKLGTVIVDCSS